MPRELIPSLRRTISTLRVSDPKYHNRSLCKPTSFPRQTNQVRIARAHDDASNPGLGSAGQSSVDPAEISHFNSLASTWWDAHGPSRLLHQMNPLRHTFIASCHASQPDPPPTHKLRYLDIGCGGGIFAESAARLSTTAAVVGVDPSTEVVDVARAHAKRDPLLVRPGRLTYLNASIEDLPVPDDVEQRADVVTLFEVLEHVARPAPFLQAVLPHVKPGGWLVVSTIARTWSSWLTTKVVAEDLIGIVPRGTHDWEKYVNEDELRAWFDGKQGWTSPRALGVVYVPGMGWKEAPGYEKLGNYFFGVRKT